MAVRMVPMRIGEVDLLAETSPAVIAQAACHTAAASGDPSFPARLIACGANVVLGAQTAVTDVYAG